MLIKTRAQIEKKKYFLAQEIPEFIFEEYVTLNKIRYRVVRVYVCVFFFYNILNQHIGIIAAVISD